MNYIEKGRNDAKAWANSVSYAPYRHITDPKLIMKLFMPTIENDMMQVARPLPKANQDWIDGFTKEMAESEI